jgi:hypothetical protein
MLHMENENWSCRPGVRTMLPSDPHQERHAMNATTFNAQSLDKTVAGAEQTPSIWRRMFDAWVSSYEARVSPDGKVWFLDL